MNGVSAAGLAGNTNTQEQPKFDGRGQIEDRKLLAESKSEANRINNKIKNELKRDPQKNLGKDDFLKLLIAQLQHQDPTKPMEDKAFIAQMAQFSSLEQMSQMSEGFGKLADTLSGQQAFNFLGKIVKVVEGNSVLTGRVDSVTGGTYPQIVVNGKHYDTASIAEVMRENETVASADVKNSNVKNTNVLNTNVDKKSLEMDSNKKAPGQAAVEALINHKQKEEGEAAL